MKQDPTTSKLHRMHEMETTVTNVRGVCPLVCLSHSSTWLHCVGVIQCSHCQITLTPDGGL